MSKLAGQVTAAASDNADLAFFLIGTNDTVDDDTFRAEYQAQVSNFMASNVAATVYLIGILPRVGNEVRRVTQNELIATVAANLGVTYINTDSWDVEKSDGLHPTTAGQIDLADRLWALLTA